MEFKDQWALLLLVLIPLTGWLLFRSKRRAPLEFSNIGDAMLAGPCWRVKLRPLLTFARLACIALLIIAIARPRQGHTQSVKPTRGAVMEIVLDCSTSMATKMDYFDMKMARLDAAKRVLQDFIGGGRGLNGRPNDILGLITFARYANTNCPLIQAPDVILGYLSDIAIANPSEDGTAIGDAISLASARLKQAEEEIERQNAKMKAASGVQNDKNDNAKFKIESKAIILLTDGAYNVGVNPRAAASLAKEWGIKIYIIGIGSPRPKQLKDIAQNTGGFYAAANNAEDLKTICAKIDELEKTEIETVEYNLYEEKFFPFALAALITLAAEIAAGCTIFRKTP